MAVLLLGLKDDLIKCGTELSDAAANDGTSDAKMQLRCKDTFCAEVVDIHVQRLLCEW